MPDMIRPRRELCAADFTGDAHAAKYHGEMGRHPEAYLRLFSLLNDPANEQRLIDAEMHGLPALCGVARFIEADPIIKGLISNGTTAVRSRQTIGVAVKLKMAKLGWRGTGRKGVVRGARHFAKAEHFVRRETTSVDAPSRALAALDAIAAVGSDEEREETAQILMDALADSRRAEGRPF
ncbi:hypothetical protein [Candidatus Poriferisodalis sp.]|uniref:hypothetical protein n=1 Tax=Candidatus Poriferisodalis sp. TaxID=3101277 RepID=UPI003B5BD723